jgi:Cu/Ag efflux protein CusF
MKSLLLLPVLLLPFLAACAPAACDCDAPTSVATESAPPVSHPVKGVVEGLLPDRQALLVKHGEVPGVMRAMTMLFKVEPAVLEKVKPGDAIQARMAKRADGWWLTDVKVVPAPK